MAPKPPLPTRKPTPSTKPSHKSSKAPTKRLKRSNKHATLLSRISKTAPASKISKRRRPSEKLVTNLSALTDALPETPDPTRGANTDARTKAENETKIKHKSLKSRPGAGRKKEKLVAMEMERFGKNMALMAAGSCAERTKLRDDQGGGGYGGSEGIGGGKGSSKERWAAIRGFISQTMERRPEQMAGR